MSNFDVKFIMQKVTLFKWFGLRNPLQICPAWPPTKSKSTYQVESKVWQSRTGRKCFNEMKGSFQKLPLPFATNVNNNNNNKKPSRMIGFNLREKAEILRCQTLIKGYFSLSLSLKRANVLAWNQSRVLSKPPSVRQNISNSSNVSWQQRKSYKRKQ